MFTKFNGSLVFYLARGSPASFLDKSMMSERMLKASLFTGAPSSRLLSSLSPHSSCDWIIAPQGRLGRGAGFLQGWQALVS